MFKKIKKNIQKIVFIADPLALFNPQAETTFFLMHEALRQGYSVLHAELTDLWGEGNQVWVRASEVKMQKKNGKFSYQIIQSLRYNLEEASVIFLRKDPPVDLSYISHLQLLSMIETIDGPLFINSPSGILRANEKIFPLQFTKISPKTCVTKSIQQAREFVAELGTAVIKPLNLSGGRGILIANKNDLDLNSLLEVATKGQTEFVMVQQFLPLAKKGDLRILLLDGEILGSFLRVPDKADFRGNMHSGARWIAAKVSKAQKEIVATLAPTLKNWGLFFVGLDFIGDQVTEVNSTSPMGIREINSINDSQIERNVISWTGEQIEARHQIKGL